jgi:hypothetical protein
LLRLTSGRARGESEERASKRVDSGGPRVHRRLRCLPEGVEQRHQSRAHRHPCSRVDADAAFPDSNILSLSPHADSRPDIDAYSPPDHTDSGGDGDGATDDADRAAHRLAHRRADRDAIPVADPESHIDLSDADIDLSDADVDLSDADAPAEPDIHLQHSHSVSLRIPRMRSPGPHFFAPVVLLLFSVASEARASLPFVEDDYPRALEQARARNVPIFLEAWAPW